MSSSYSIKDIRLSQDASFHSLSLICSFLSENPQDAVLRFGPVCRRWHEVMTTQCRDMWTRLCMKSFPQIRRPRATYHEFSTIANSSLFKRKTESDPFKALEPIGQLNDIENCVGNNDDDGAENGEIDFSFSCPVLAQNLHRLHNESTESGLPILFCDICKKKVYTVENGKELDSAVRQGRCVTLTEAASRLVRNNNDAVNIGFIVSNDDQANLISSMFLVANRVPAFDSDERWNPTFASQNMFQANKYDTSPRNWKFHLLKANDFIMGEENNAKKRKGIDTDLRSPLSDENAPKDGGWAYLIVFPQVVLTGDYDEKNGFGQMKALKNSNRIFFVQETKHSNKKDGVEEESVVAPNIDSAEAPEKTFAKFWNLIESQIIDEFKAPRHARGKIAYIRHVRVSGPTRAGEKAEKEKSNVSDNDDDDSDGETKKTKKCAIQ